LLPSMAPDGRVTAGQPTNQTLGGMAVRGGRHGCRATHDIVAHRADAVLDAWLERMRLQ